ncbi:MAG: type V CRISPR-associated protein Cas4, partial [bacterium]|nr:type V CRISPR-associated protein Cas4 [bacterium]
YCPRSVYLHSIYENFNDKVFHQVAQVAGRLNHSSIDENRYSSAKKYLQALPVYSEKYGIAGKIDIYDSEKKHLIERKTKIKKIWQGYIYQLYGQYFCLKEMGYEIEKMFLYSMEDNKKYEIEIPSEKEMAEFEATLEKIRNYNPLLDKEHSCLKCKDSVYGGLAW